MSALDEMERYCIRQIREMQERHQQELKPLVDYLVSIYNLRPPAPIYVEYGMLTA